MQQIHACKEPRLKMDFGSLWSEKGGERGHFVGDSRMQGGRLGADVPLLSCTPG